MATGSTKTHGRFALTRPPRDDDELYSLVLAMWGVTVPRHKVCTEHDAPFDWFADSFFARQPQTIALGSRGLSGKSYAMAVLGLTEAVVWGSDVNIVGGSESQSRNLHEHMRADWEHPNAPTFMVADDHTQITKLTNRARIRPLTASQKTVRGPHPARLLVDEVDEVDYAILQAAFGQPMPQKNWLGIEIPAQTAMTSTWQYPDGTMMKELQRFEENGLKSHSWCYRESMNPYDGWLSESFVEQKKREIPRQMWETEYELQEPSIGSRAFDPASVERMFDTDPSTPLKNSREFQEYHFEDYDRSYDYVVAADWAKTTDFTVISVWRVSDLPMKLVHWVRVHRQPYPRMIGYFNRLQKEYAAEGIHDATGLGGVVADLLDGASVWNFLMTGRNRDDMLSEFVAAVENDRVRAPKIPQFYTAVKYCSVEDMYSRSQEYHLPDEVCSAALAWKAVSHRFPAVEPFGSPKTDTNWMDEQVRYNRQHVAVDSTWRIDSDVKRTDDQGDFWSLTG